MEELYDILMDTDDDLSAFNGKVQSGGRINALSAMQYAQATYGGMYPPLSEITEVSFSDTYNTVNSLGGDIEVTFGSGMDDVEFIKAYFINSNAEKIMPSIPLLSEFVSCLPAFCSGQVIRTVVMASGGVAIPPGAVSIAVFAGNGTGTQGEATPGENLIQPIPDIGEPQNNGGALLQGVDQHTGVDLITTGFSFTGSRNELDITDYRIYAGK
jgi:hypothetical protein